MSDFTREATVLVYRPRRVRGAGAIVEPERLDGRDRRDLEWAVSWKGTHRLP